MMKAQDEQLDLLVVGGGINGAGIAADAAIRGMKVGLFESRDFASATSSASSKLIHGGLRYLEHYEFRLVKEALAEREVLLNIASHIAWPMRFRLPHRPHLRPAWMIRAGLFLYDTLATRATLPASKSIKFGPDSPVETHIKKGFEYSDCWVDDARLVVLNAMLARKHHAEVRNYCKVVGAQRKDDHWVVSIYDKQKDEIFTRKCKVLVNAAGPWVREFYSNIEGVESPYNIRHIKGSHIVVPRVNSDKQAYILQNEDKRIVFVIPYLDKFSIIGTTDVEYKGDVRDVSIDEEEITYLLDVYNKHFKKKLFRKNVVWTYSGVRPLCDDESDSPDAITRDYTLSLDGGSLKAPLVSVFGGKLTTYRKLSKAAVDSVKQYFPDLPESKTAETYLPGSTKNFNRETVALELQSQHSWMNSETALRYANTYGELSWTLLAGVQQQSDMGVHIGNGFYEKELNYLIKEEFVTEVKDILWRRTKLGLYLKSEEVNLLEGMMTKKTPEISQYKHTG